MCCIILMELVETRDDERETKEGCHCPYILQAGQASGEKFMNILTGSSRQSGANLKRNSTMATIGLLAANPLKSGP